MKMIKAIIRPEKYIGVLEELNKNGYRAVTRSSVLGRGKQKGLKVGDVYYDEIPKESLMIVVENKEVEQVIEIISTHSKTSQTGSYGDGKIFVTPVEKVVTISSGEEGL